MESLLNFQNPLDIKLLDATINAVFFSQNPQERDQAQRILAQFQEHPDAWTRVDTIIETSQNQNTKFFALQILEKAIRFRWKALPVEQREGIKKYIVNLIIQLSRDYDILQREKVFLTKLNTVLVQIIKQEWPKNWETFIPEVVNASKTNESLCENSMNIFRLMSEEVFDFPNEQTRAKAKELKESFGREFSLIFQLCEFVLGGSQRPSLLHVTLQTLSKFLSWIGFGYIFDTKLMDVLVMKFLAVPIFRNVTLECLTEIASIVEDNYNPHFEKLIVQTMAQLRLQLSLQTDIANAYDDGNEDFQTFIHHFALFLCSFYGAHRTFLERSSSQAVVVECHKYLAKISFVDDVELFKMCLEYWGGLVLDLYHENPQASTQLQALLLTSPLQATSPRRLMYSEILSTVRLALISKMPKPEEVLIVEDENGEIVRETMKDSDAIALYQSMRETLVLLTHLDCDDTQNIMLDKLSKQVDGSEWSWYNINTLCWAIGAISGAMNEEYEKRFLVTVIKELLGLVEMKRGKDNKAVIASNIMYIVGQYPRFLLKHWKFLKTVVNKLFEFMHESHPGVQDMACDTFLTIAKKCRRKFVVLQIGETVPFIDEILTTLPQIISDLESSQIQVFYEAVGYMIQVQTDVQIRENLLARLMELPNRTWAELMSQASQNIEVLRNVDVCRNISNILKTNERACFSLGHFFLPQIGKIYLDLLNVYKVYSEMITNAAVTGGPTATRTTLIIAMRRVKKEALRLIGIFIENSDDPAVVHQNLVAPLLWTVLTDYKQSIPDTRDAEVLYLMTVIINKLQERMNNDVPRMLADVFECTLQMITKNLQDYPEHRLHFFSLLRAVNQCCFQSFYAMSAGQFKLVVDSIVWAFKHTERSLSEIGLNVLYEMLKKVQETGIESQNAFYQSYYLSILQDIFFVLTDTLHKFGFKLQSFIIATMFQIVDSGLVNVPLWGNTKIQEPNMTNQKFVREYVINMLVTAFPNLPPTNVRNYVLGLFELSKDMGAFKNHLRDFLIHLKEFSTSGDNEDLYREEKDAATQAAREAEKKRKAAVPGLLPPSEMRDDMGE